MTDDSRPDESPDSAFDGELADQLDIDATAELRKPTDRAAQAGDPAAPDPSASAAPPRSKHAPRHSRRRSAATGDGRKAPAGDEAGPANAPGDDASPQPGTGQTQAGQPEGKQPEGKQPEGKQPQGDPSGAEQPDGEQSARDAGAGDEAPDGDGEAKAKKRRRKAPWWELPALALFAIAIAILVKTFVVQPFYIPSQSMEKTLHGCPGCSGDRILVNKPIYDLRDPHPGDIVVFHAPKGWDEEPASKPPSNPIVRAVRGFGQLIGFVPPDGLVLVKRVIATGGQTVKGDASGVYVSDDGPDGRFRKLSEPYVYDDGTDGHADFGPVTVPKGRLWVMGDHRNDSADSRFHCDESGSGSNDGPECDPTTSTVPIDKVIGKAVIIAWPPSRWRTLGTPSTFKQAAMASGGALPAAGSMAFALPIWFVRRRRRTRRARRS